MVDFKLVMFHQAMAQTQKKQQTQRDFINPQPHCWFITILGVTPLNQPSEFIDAELIMLILAPISSMSRSIGCWTESNDESNGLHKTRFPERVVFEFRIPNISNWFKLIQIDHIGCQIWNEWPKWPSKFSGPCPLRSVPKPSSLTWWVAKTRCSRSCSSNMEFMPKREEGRIMIYHIYASFKLAFIHVYPTSLWFNMFRSSVQDLQDIL